MIMVVANSKEDDENTETTRIRRIRRISFFFFFVYVVEWNRRSSARWTQRADGTLGVFATRPNAERCGKWTGKIDLSDDAFSKPELKLVLLDSFKMSSSGPGVALRRVAGEMREHEITVDWPIDDEIDREFHGESGSARRIN